MISSADDMLGALRAAVADPTQVKIRALDLHAGAHDASHFLMIPQAVVVAGNADEVGRLLRASASQGVPLTFRSGGTSLSGQALSDGVLETLVGTRVIESVGDSQGHVEGTPADL